MKPAFDELGRSALDQARIVELYGAENRYS